jgi:hypothetical protein
MYSSTHSLTSALEGDEWSASRPGRFTPRERVPGTHWLGGWVGSRAVLDAVVKRKIPGLAGKEPYYFITDSDHVMFASYNLYGLRHRHVCNF